MPLPTTFEAAREIVARNIVAQQQAKADAWVPKPVGVSWSGLTSLEERPRVQTVEEVVAELQAREAFRQSPRGRFLAVIDELEDVGAYAAEADRLRGYYNRSITALNGPVADEAAVRACIRLLNTILTPDARAGVVALLDLLDEQAPLKAVA